MPEVGEGRRAKARSEKEGGTRERMGEKERDKKKKRGISSSWGGRQAGRQVGRACMAVRLMHARLNVHSRSIKGRSKSTTS